MWITKLALLTCAFYLVLCGIIELMILMALRLRWASMIGFQGIGLFLVFGVVWLVSFYLAVRIEHANFRAKLPPSVLMEQSKRANRNLR